MKRISIVLLSACVWATAGYALSPKQRAALNGTITPTVQANFLSNLTMPSWLTFSRSSNAMYYDSTGQLTYAPSNVIVSSASYTAQTVTVPNGVKHLFSAYGAVGETIVFPAGCGGGTWTGTGPSNRVTLSFTTSAASCVLPASSAGTVTNAQLEAVTYQTNPGPYIDNTSASAAYYGPRFSYDPTTLLPNGLMLEEARTSYARASENLANNTYWNPVGDTAAASAVVGPDGSGTLQLITQGGSGGRIELSISTFSTGVNNTVSFYLKPNSANYVTIAAVAGSTNAGCILNLTGNGSVVSTAGAQVVSAKITKEGSLYRGSLTFLANGSPGQIIIGVSDGSTYSFGVYPSAASGTVYAGFAGLEAGSFATSYIPVPAAVASATRATDSVVLAGAAATIANAASGSAIIQTTSWEGAGDAARYLLASSATRALLYSNSSNTSVSSTDGTTILSTTIPGQTLTSGAVRSGISWDAQGRSLVANKGGLSSDTTSLSTGASTYLGGATTASTFNGWIASLAFYTQRLPSGLLFSKSAVGSNY